MTEKIRKKDVKKISELSGLSLADDELLEFAKLFTDTLEYMDMLDELNTEGVDETYQVTGLTNVFQENSRENSKDGDDINDGSGGKNDNSSSNNSDNNKDFAGGEGNLSNCLKQDVALKNAKEARDGFFTTEAVFERS